MNKIIIEVFCPILEKSFDMIIPSNVSIYDIKLLISENIEKICGQKLFNGNHVVLCERSTGKTYLDDKTPKELNIENGKKIMIF